MDLKVLCEGKKTLRNAFSPKLGASVLFDKGGAVDAILLLAENSKDFIQSQRNTLSFLCSSFALLSITVPNNKIYISPDPVCIDMDNKRKSGNHMLRQMFVC